ncbi:MAG: glycosyltransferase family 4 protein [Planctomycetales bacterium]|nr:glycosyltransferase family 4 protein [Planctomycetales bacterium]
MRSDPALLVISQVYVPDPASVGQHMHDAAAELVRRGYRVIVYTASRGYDDPSNKYPKRETLDGVTIRRLPCSSFGKKSIKIRLLAQTLFLLQVMLRGLFTRKLDRILVSTSPPMASMAAVFISFFRRVPITFWAMDINPDQVVAMGQTSQGSLVVRVFEVINRAILRRARGVVALDRFMAARLEAKEPVGDRMAVMPPWPHESHLEPVAHQENPFRKEHGLEGKFVIMYSGNISPAHPITTILEAAKQMEGDERVVFLFIGGGNGKRQIDAFVEREKLRNVITLPYQPLDKIKFSLSAGDVHLVAMGDEMVGIVHPCKVYGAMTVARPVLLLGPMESHVGELLAEYEFGWQVDHGNVDGARELIGRIASTDQQALTEMGQRARDGIRRELSMKALSARFCDVVQW